MKSLSEKQKLFKLCAKRWAEINPDPKCELFFFTPYQLLVSVILSAQATDKGVNKCMEPLYREGFDPLSVLAMGEDALRETIKTIGLYKNKAKNIYKTTQILVQQFNSKVPSDMETLVTLPGVGRKTANVILGEIFKLPTLAVDTHVMRVSRRLGFHAETNPDKIEKELMEVIPKSYLPKAHHWFILHGRYTCNAKKPLCSSCILNDLCESAPER